MLTCPVPCMGSRVPVVSNGFRPGHLGQDWMFDRSPSDPPYAKSNPRGTPGFYVPDNTPVVAVTQGKVIYAERKYNAQGEYTGMGVRLEAGDGVHHLSLHILEDTLRVATGEVVTEGQLLGVMGGDPSSNDPHHTIHDHQELRPPAPRGTLRDNWNRVPVDPAPAFKFCRYVHVPQL